jgi:hypothetical protein
MANSSESDPVVEFGQYGLVHHIHILSHEIVHFACLIKSLELHDSTQAIELTLAIATTNGALFVL